MDVPHASQHALDGSFAAAAPAATSPFTTARTGDVFLMNRKCQAMKDPLAIGLCFLTKTENRFDHVGMLVKISEEDLANFPETKKRMVDSSPSDTYVLETSMKGITLFSAERRMERSSAYELAARTVEIDGACGGPGATAEGDRLNHKMLRLLETMYDAPYQNDFRAILPSIFSPPDKMDRIEAAHKVNSLRMEMAALEASLSHASQQTTATPQPEGKERRADAYRTLLAAYRQATVEMLDIYFPHLHRTSATEAVWDTDHLWIDGENYSAKMMCTELIGNLWLRAGITNGFVPASSLRPFDFFDDVRFNFADRGMRLGELVPIKVSSSCERYWAETPEGSSATRNTLTSAATATREGDADAAKDAHLKFYNNLLHQSGLPRRRSLMSLEEVTALKESGMAVVPTKWIVQSNDQSCVRDLGARLFGVGVLFSFWAVPCAPLTLQWVEGQVGLFLVRGSVWSLSCGFLARNLAFATVQGVTAWALGRLVAAPTHHAARPACDVMRSRAAASGSLVDWRHPYYSVAAVFAASSVVAHVVTQPIVSSVLSHHFGPLRVGPLPRRLLLRGAFCLAPFSVLMPMQGYFLAWYETGGSFVIPTRSSVFRPRPEMLDLPNWPHLRNDALVGAFGAMLLFDLLLYPLQTGVARSLVRALYHPQPSPSIGRRFYPAYRYRFASNLLISGATCASLSFLFHLL